MDFKAFSETELNGFSKKMLISLYLQIASSFQLLNEQNETILKQSEQLLEQNEQQLKQIENLQESIAILTNQRFGRKTEKTKEIIDGQIVMDLNGELLLLNEAEVLAESEPEEKSEEELLAEAKEKYEKQKRKKGQRETDLRMAKVLRQDFEVSEEKLKELFPEGYTELPDKITHRVEYEPARLIVFEEHIHQYISKKGHLFASARGMDHLLPHSIVTPSLAAKIIYDKYIKAVPINRIGREFSWLDVTIRPPTISRWLIRLTDKYLIPVSERMKWFIKQADLIHCDETPFVCEEDRKKEGRTKNSKSYMWVYHTADQYGSPPIFIYEYKDNRRTENVEAFLKAYHGVIMADGYEPYHTVAKKSKGDIVVAGCWAHLKRKFMDVIKTDPKNAVGTVAYEGNERIAKIYHTDNKMKDAPAEERLKYRREKVAPLVNSFFDWIRDINGKVATQHTQIALTYALNQEIYLRAFLDNGIIPLDNSDAERSIRSFCVGKHNWHIAASSHGAETSGILYSIAETAKANGLKPYDYFKYLFEELLDNEDNITDELIDSLLPWSATLPAELKNTK